MTPPYAPEVLRDAILTVVGRNGHQSCYIRPVVFRGMGSLSVDPRKSPIEGAVATIEWGRYLGEEALEQGVDVMVSSWRRMAPDTHPGMAKIGGDYVNSSVVAMGGGEEEMPGEMLYVADEIFFAGTAAEITPVRSVDRIPVGAGRRGPITTQILEEFFGIAEGQRPDRHGWLTPVRAAAVRTASS